MNNRPAPWLENSDSMNFFFSILASLCSFDELTKEKFSSTIDDFFHRCSKRRFCILFNEIKSNDWFWLSLLFIQVEQRTISTGFYSKRNKFCFLWWREKIFHRLKERLIEMIFSLRELSLLDNSAPWQMRKRTMKVSSLINRLHLSTFDWQKEEKMFVSSTNSLGEKTRQQTNGSFLLPTTQIKRQIRRDWRRVRCSTENLIVTTFLFLFRRFIQVKHKSFDASIKSLAEESIDKTNVSSLKQNTLFFIRIFLFENKTVGKDFFISTERKWWKKVQSFTQIRCRWKINESKK